MGLRLIAVNPAARTGTLAGNLDGCGPQVVLVMRKQRENVALRERRPAEDARERRLAERACRWRGGDLPDIGDVAGVREGVRQVAALERGRVRGDGGGVGHDVALGRDAVAEGVDVVVISRRLAVGDALNAEAMHGGNTIEPAVNVSCLPVLVSQFVGTRSVPVETPFDISGYRSFTRKEMSSGISGIVAEPRAQHPGT